jgi:hypothetical protein
MNDDELLNELLNPITDEEWMKNLPFDLEKLKAGDENEILKYIEYLKKYPERAVYLGIPLDIHSALRGGFGNFNWGGFDSFGGGSEASSKEGGTRGKITGPQKDVDHHFSTYRNDYFRNRFWAKSGKAGAGTFFGFIQ